VLAQPSDLRLQAPALADLLGDDGEVSAEKVAAAAAALVTARPGMRKTGGPAPLPGGSGAPPPGPPPNLVDVVRRVSQGRL
jgi:hypothetical protein